MIGSPARPTQGATASGSEFRRPLVHARIGAEDEPQPCLSPRPTDGKLVHGAALHLAGAVALAVIAVLLLRVLGRRTPRRPRLPYTKRASLLTPAEQRFYRVLLQALPKGMTAFVKVRLLDVVSVPDKAWREYARARERDAPRLRPGRRGDGGGAAGHRVGRQEPPAAGSTRAGSLQGRRPGLGGRAATARSRWLVRRRGSAGEDRIRGGRKRRGGPPVARYPSLCAALSRRLGERPRGGKVREPRAMERG